MAFQVVSVHSVYNSALFLPSCCCPFLLHAVAKLICILLVSLQLFLLSTLPKFLHFLWSKSVHPALLLKFFLTIDVSRFLSVFSKGPNFASILKNGDSQCIVYFVVENLWTTFGLKCCLEVPVFEQMLLVLLVVPGVVKYLLTPWSRVLLEKLTGSAASQEFPRIFGTRRFITVLTSARHLSLS